MLTYNLGSALTSVRVFSLKDQKVGDRPPGTGMDETHLIPIKDPNKPYCELCGQNPAGSFASRVKSGAVFTSCSKDSVIPCFPSSRSCSSS